MSNLPKVLREGIIYDMLKYFTGRKSLDEDELNDAKEILDLLFSEYLVLTQGEAESLGYKLWMLGRRYNEATYEEKTFKPQFLSILKEILEKRGGK